MSATSFAELADVLDRMSTLVKPVYIVSDVNVHLMCFNDSAACDLCDIFTVHGLLNCISSPTHNLGGSLDRYHYLSKSFAC